MKSKTLFLIISVLVIAGIAISGYFKAIPGVENQGGSLPQIEITPKSFDFGEINYGEIVEYSFKVKNLGDENLEIKRVATSCACTTAEIEKEVLSPGEEVELLVTYDTGAMSGAHAKGEQERIIYLKSNDPVNPQVEAMIYAVVR